MTNRELLELAAKAAGVAELTFSADMECPYNPLPESGNIYWNPLRCDGDALRLAVQQGLEICRGHDAIRGEFCEVFYRPRKYARQKSCIEYFKDNPDPLAATRRAIVRAASSIGGKL